MNIVVYSVIAVIVLSFIGIIACFKSNDTHQNCQFSRLSLPEFEEGMRELCRSLRRVSKGGGLYSVDLYSNIKTAIKMIDKCLDCGKIPTLTEKWLYENDYRIRRLLQSTDFSSLWYLPMCKGEPRILSISKYIISHSLGDLDANRLNGAIKAANSEVELGMEESLNFRQGLNLAVIWGITWLADKIIQARRMEYHALQGCDIESKYIKSDVYLFFLTQNNCIPNLSERLGAFGININEVKLNYGLYMAELTSKAKYLFDALRFINDEWDSSSAYDYSSVSKLLEADTLYSVSDAESKRDIQSRISLLAESLNMSEIVVTKKLLAFSAYNGMFCGKILQNHAFELKRYLKGGNLFRIKTSSPRRREYSYIFGIVALSAVIMLAICYLSGKNPWAGVLGAIPSLIVADACFNVALHTVNKPKVIYKLNQNKLPNVVTNVLVSEYITSAEDMQRAIRHIKVLQAGNKDSNIIVSLLADLKKSDSEIHSSDAEITKIAKEAISDESNLAVYIRKRIKIGKSYIGWERKRGALLDIMEALDSGNFEKFALVEGKRAKLRPFYILTLDGDNLLNVVP